MTLGGSTDRQVRTIRPWEGGHAHPVRLPTIPRTGIRPRVGAIGRADLPAVADRLGALSDRRLAAVPEGLQARFTGFRPLGTGGASSVYRARRREDGIEVAVKLLRDPENDVSRRRFLREAEALARVSHPAVVRIEESGVSDGVPFLVMELVPGDPMSQLPPGTDPLPPMLRIAEGLEAVHRAGLVHRDVKPSNMVLTPEGRAVLVDFGLAFDSGEERLTMIDRVPGTLSYLSPERLGGAAPAASADWWAWGVSLYALLEGGLPFANHELFQAASGADLPELHFTRLSPGDRRIHLLRACLALDARRRPSGRADLERLLDPAGGGSPVRRPGAGVQVAVGLAAALVTAALSSRCSTPPPMGGPAGPPPASLPAVPATRPPDPVSQPPGPEPTARATSPAAIPMPIAGRLLEGPVEALARDARGRLVAAGPTGVALLAEGVPRPVVLSRHALAPAEGERRVALAADGSLLVSADRSGLLVFDPHQGVPLARAPAFDELPAGLAISPRGPTVFASWNDGRLVAFAPERPGTPRWTRRFARRPFPLLATGDGEHLVVAELGDLHLLDVATGSSRGHHALEATVPPPLALSPDGMRLAAADAVGDLHLLTLPGLPVRRLASGARRTPLALAMGRDRIAVVNPGPVLVTLPFEGTAPAGPGRRLDAAPRCMVFEEAAGGSGTGTALLLGLPDGSLERVEVP